MPPGYPKRRQLRMKKAMSARIVDYPDVHGLHLHVEPV